MHHVIDLQLWGAVGGKAWDKALPCTECASCFQAAAFAPQRQPAWLLFALQSAEYSAQHWPALHMLASQIWT